MTYEKLKSLKSANRTLKLLNSDNFAFYISFFYLTFTKSSKDVLLHSEILSHLDDYLYNINQIYDNVYPRAAKEYLDEFVSEKNAYLKKYHSDADEAAYELTPYTQKALEMVESLDKKEFVGSRSKFNIIFELLEELEFETNLDDTERIKRLQEQKKDIDKQIDAITNKRDIRFDNARIKEHYMQLEEMARKLKYDFSEIEYNFRKLNSLAMEKIALSTQAKADVLSSIFDEEDEIKNSDQGKSFFGFWQLLSDANQNERLSRLIENLYSIKAIDEFDDSHKLKDLKFSLLKSCEKVYGVSSKLIEQLRRFLDDRLWIENKRILELCSNIEKSAIEIKDEMPNEKNFMPIDGCKVELDSIFFKSLYTPKIKQEFNKELKEQDIELSMSSFYDLFFIDEELLSQNIQKVLLKTPQTTLAKIAKEFAIKKGIAELVGYISIAKNSQSVVVDESKSELITIVDSDGVQKKVSVPKIIFVRDL